ncbi:PTS transporter subunit EIIC [Levilactobacillus tujiorum]|uniref:PTS transporter subunit EIIC n=1 Tax=Levilactobacillus tujiorum TaxID=2912243 RepID=UPI001456EE74|nr:PTS transporter subunit EIIC [Levilactobacillus tujiorum]NLR32963.1 PTS sugar transporter subunit IIC [Levilactobacillus tujiorum]
MVGWLRELWRLNQRVGQWRAMRAVREALRVAYPFILVMAFVDVIGQGFLSKSGFFFQVYHVGSWLPGIDLWRQSLQAVSVVVNGLVAVMVAFTTGHYLAKIYRTEPLAVGMMSALAFLTLNVNYDALGQGGHGDTDANFLEVNLGPQGIFLAILVGLGVGWLASHLMRWLATWWLRHRQVTLSWTGRVAWTLTVVLGLTVAVGYGISWLVDGGINNLVYLALQTLNTNVGHQGLRILAVTAVSNCLWWLGLIGPIDVAGNSSVTSLQNLAYAVQHGSGWGAPYPVTLHTLSDAYANFGGAGMTLALLIAVWIGSRQASYRRVANQTFLPNLLNLNEPTLLGLPVLFNPILFIPFVMAPAVNIAIAWVAITWKLVPPIVYPVPRTTPGPLVAYLGTGGDWRALLLSSVCLVVSVLIYLPFVRLLNDEGSVDHAA